MNGRISFLWAFVTPPDHDEDEGPPPIHLVRLAISPVGQMMAAFPHGNRWVGSENVVSIIG